MRSVVPFAAGTAAVGHDREHGAVWLSNGIEWRRVAADSPALAAGADRPDVDLRDVQTLAGGLVAVGDVLTADGDRDAAVWTSRDGETWSIVRSPAFQGPADEQMIAVATGGFGAVAVGCASCETPGARPVVWRSPDGRTWRRVPASELPQADGLEQLATVTVAGDVLVAGGRHGDDAVVWTTPIAG
jgi:hypothetical protein